MSQQFAIPPVGSKIRVTVRVQDNFIFSPSRWRDAVFEGTVLPNNPWTRVNAFNMSGDADWPIREVGIDMVTDLEMLDGTAAPKVDVDNAVKIITVPGSKPGTNYTVTKVGNKVTCNCPGFGFRKTCKHTALI